MTSLLCATGNPDKFGIGQSAFKKFGINLEQVVINIDEIQGEDPEVIIKDKAQKAFDALQKPVVVTDDSWLIPALNGFPGPYMKSINHWFTPDDFINLMKTKADRTIILHQALAYADGNEVVTFENDVIGRIATKPAGNYGPPIMKVAILGENNHRTISQRYDHAEGEHEINPITNNVWQELAKWYKQKTAV